MSKHLQPDMYQVRPVSELISQGLYLEGAGGSDIAYIGYTELTVRLGKQEQAPEVRVPFLITNTKCRVPILGSNAMEVLLEGDDWQEKMERLASFGLEQPDVLVLTGILDRWMEDAVVASVTACQDVIPAKSAKIIHCKIEATTIGSMKPVIFQPNAEWEAANNALTLYDTVLHLDEGTNEEIAIQVRNTSDYDFHFEDGDCLGLLEEIDLIEDSTIQYHDFEDVESEMANVNNIDQSPVLIGTTPDHWQTNNIDKSPVLIGTTPDHWQTNNPKKSPVLRLITGTNQQHKHVHRRSCSLTWTTAA